jgi:hypothetical protein
MLIKQRARLAAHTDEMKNCTEILSENLKEKNIVADKLTGVDERIILKWDLRKQDTSVSTAFKWLMTGASGEHL